jgi:uncharacterized protein YndB with AHSA1/START domain
VWLDETPVVRRSIETVAYPEQVWEALTDTDLLGHWMADRATGWPAVGGTLSWTWERFGLTLDYKVSEVKVCQRLVLKTPMGNGMQTVTFELRRHGGSTWVDVTDAPPPFTPPNPHSSADSTWQMSLAVLKLYVERYFRRARNNFMVVARASFTFPEVVAAYATPEGLCQWLAARVDIWPAAPSPVGHPYRLLRADGGTMSGQVLAVTNSEAVLGWDEIDGFLELKSFSLGPGNQMLALRGSSYSPARHDAAQLEEMLKPLLIQLAEYLES